MAAYPPAVTPPRSLQPQPTYVMATPQQQAPLVMPVGAVQAFYTLPTFGAMPAYRLPQQAGTMQALPYMQPHTASAVQPYTVPHSQPAAGERGGVGALPPCLVSPGAWQRTGTVVM